MPRCVSKNFGLLIDEDTGATLQVRYQLHAHASSLGGTLEPVQPPATEWPFLEWMGHRVTLLTYEAKRLEVGAMLTNGDFLGAKYLR